MNNSNEIQEKQDLLLQQVAGGKMVATKLADGTYAMLPENVKRYATEEECKNNWKDHKKNRKCCKKHHHGPGCNHEFGPPKIEDLVPELPPMLGPGDGPSEN